MRSIGKIGMLAMTLDRLVDQIDVYTYQVIIEEGFKDDVMAIQQTRKVVTSVRSCNAWSLLTDLGDYKLVSIKPLTQLSFDNYGVKGRLKAEESIQLDATIDKHRHVIQRLVKQDIEAGLSHFSLTSKNQNGSYQYQLERTRSGQTELVETNPSERIQARSEYLELFKSIRVEPEILPSGKVILSLFIKHKIFPRNGINLQWVINKRPEWLTHIKRVRHRYTENGKPTGVAEYIQLRKDKSASDLLPGKSESIFTYHLNRANFKPSEEERVKQSDVVSLKYGKNFSADHLAELLEPMFDFETLQRLDSKLLNGIARDLKWPVVHRLREAGKILKGLELPCLGTKACVEDYSISGGAKNICPPFNLLFSRNKQGSHEEEVINKKAYKGMTRSQVVCIAIGHHASDKKLNEHFEKVRAACQKLSAEQLPPWKGVNNPQALSSPQELNTRLKQNLPENTLLLIAIDKSVKKEEIRDIAFRHKLACQFMLTDYPEKTYSPFYYNNLAAGVFSKGGGLICGLGNMQGEVDLFIGLDMGGVHQRAPGSAFLFTRNGAQLGWQLADVQSGERMSDNVLERLLRKSIDDYIVHHQGELPRNLVIHRDGKFYENLKVIETIEAEYGININVLEVIKSGAPVLYRKNVQGSKKIYTNPEVGDCYRYKGLDELILATYSGKELKNWGEKVTVNPLRLRKRYGNTDIEVLAQQVLLLSRIHGASLYRHPRLPVTTHHADRFATLRQTCDVDALSHMDRKCPVYL